MRLSRHVPRLSVLLLLTALLVVLSVVTPAQAGAAIPACGPGISAPCLADFTVDGAAPPVGWSVEVSARDADGAHGFHAAVLHDGLDYDLGAGALGRTISITLDLGSVVPRVVSGKGQGVDVVRGGSPGSYTLTVTGQPVTLSGQCAQATWPWVCPEHAVATSPEFNNIEWEALFTFDVTDFGQWTDVAQRRASYGLTYFENLAASTGLPAIVDDPSTGESMLRIDVANRRFREDGATLVQGHLEMRVPNEFLRVAYGVPNPALMTGSSLVLTGTGGAATATVGQEPGGDAMLVEVDGLTFPDVHVADGTYRVDKRAAKRSVKRLRVKRGLITPVRPGWVKAKRVKARKARVSFARARVRGAKVTRYQVRCVGKKHTVKAATKKPRVTLKHLKRGTKYQCRVRAMSKAGPSAWRGAKKRI